MPRSGREYERIDRTRFDRIDAVSSGPDCLAVATGTDVRLVGASQERFQLPEPVVDVAVGSTIGVLTEGSLYGFARDGTREWRLPADEHAIAARPEMGLFGLAGPETVRSLDAETGSVETTTERPRTGTATDDELLGTAAGFLLSTWSFVTRFDDDGTIAFDRDLGSVVRGLGAVGDTLFVAVNSGRCYGLDARSGGENWRLERSLSGFEPIDDETTLALTADDVVELTTAGDLTPLPSLPYGVPYYRPQQDRVSIVTDRTARTYRPALSPVDCTVQTDAVGPGEAVVVSVSNPEPVPRTPSLTATIGGASLSRPSVDVDIGPNERVEVEFPVDRVSNATESEFAISTDGSTRGSWTIELRVEPAADSPVDIDFEPVVIDHGTVELSLSVENVSSTPIESVTILETGTESDRVGPGESWQAELTRQYEPDGRVSCGIEVTTASASREYAPTCPLPPPITIQTEPIDDTIHATLHTPAEIPITDTLVFDLPGIGRSRTQLTVPDAELLVVLPRFESGVARVSLDGVDVDERVRLSDQPVSTSTSSRTLREDRTTASHSTTREKPDATEAEAHVTKTETPASSSDATRSADSSHERVAVERQLAQSSAPAGTAVDETIVVSNDGGAAIDIALTTESDASPSEAVSGTDSVAISRSIAPPAGRPDEAVEIPDPPITADGTPIEHVDLSPTAIEERAGLRTRAIVDPTTDRLALELSNDTADSVRVTSILVDDVHCDGFGPVEPGDSDVVSRSLSAWNPAHRLETGAGYPICLELETGTRRSILAETRPGLLAAETDEPRGLDGLEPTIGSATQVVEPAGTVVLVVENETDRTVTDVSLSARGSQINEKFYAQARRDVLEPGDRIEHFVDLSYESTEPSFEAIVQYTVDGAQTESAVRVSGQAAPDPTSWDDETLASWRIESLSSSALPALEAADDSPITTPFVIERNPSR